MLLAMIANAILLTAAQIAKQCFIFAMQTLIRTPIANTPTAVAVATAFSTILTILATLIFPSDTKSVIVLTTAQTNVTNEMQPERIAHRSHVPIIPIIRLKPVSETQRVIPTQAHPSVAAQPRAPATKKQVVTPLTATTPHPKIV